MQHPWLISPKFVVTGSLLAGLASAGLAAPARCADYLAYLSDRVALAQGGPQQCGTQRDIKGECELEFRSFDDRAKVEARRKAIGWPSLDAYRQLVLHNAMPEKCRSR